MTTQADTPAVTSDEAQPADEVQPADQAQPADEVQSADPLAAALAGAAQWRAMTRRVKEVIVDRLELPIPPEWMTDDQPLFGRGLELDSLDALELSMAIDQEFGTPVYEENTALFGSVSAFLTYMLQRYEELPPEEAERMRALVLAKTGIDDVPATSP